MESRYKINLPPNTDAVFELPYLLSAIPYAKTPIISKIEVVDPIQPTEGQTLISPISVTRSVAWFDVKKKGALKRSDEIEVVAGKRLRLVGRTRPKRSGKIVAEIIEPFTGKVLSHMSSRAGRNGWFLLDAERKVRPRGAYTLRMKWKNQPASGWKCVTGVRALKP